MKSDRLVNLSLFEKVGYASGDFGFNLYWKVIELFLAVYYTEVFGLPPATAATMFLVTKIVDAFTDPVMGAVADRTNTRWGKFRPYLLFAGLPMAGAAVLTFTTPDFSLTGKTIYAYITYSLLMIGYTILSTPYSALSGVLSAKSQERTTLISFRFIAAFAGGLFVSKYTLAIVEFLGGGNEVRGWQLTMLLYGLAAALVFVFTFLTTKERIVPKPEQSSRPLEDIKDLLGNKAWLILFALAMIIMVTITLRGGSSYYYLKYFAERPDLIPNYLTFQLAALLIGATLTPVLTQYVDKTKLLLILMGLVGIFSFAFFFVPKDGIVAMFVLNVLISLCLGPKSPLTWSMYADSADYTEWKTGRRATGMTFAAATFSQKMGGALGSSVMLWILAGIGYVAKEAQTDASKDGIVFLQTVLPGIFAIVAAAVVVFYPLTAEKLEVIQKELKEREEEESIDDE